MSPAVLTMATRSSGSSRNAWKVSPISREVLRSMALAFGRSSVTSRMRALAAGGDDVRHGILLVEASKRSALPPRARRSQGSSTSSASAIQAPLPFGADDQRIDVELLDRAGIRDREVGDAESHRPPRRDRPSAGRDSRRAAGTVSGRAAPPRCRARVAGSSSVALSFSSSTSTPPEPIVITGPNSGSRVMPTISSATPPCTMRST